MADLTVDLWQTFDSTPLDTTNLDADDHFATTGRWTINDTGSKLSNSTSGEHAFSGTIGGEVDTGTRGLAYDSTGGNQAYLAFAHPAQRTQLSWGFRFKVTGAAFFSSFGEYDLCRNSTDLGVDPSLMKVVDDTNETRFHLFVPSDYSAGIAIEADTWYWVTGKHVKNETVIARLYAENGTQIGDELSMAVGNENLTEFLLGPLAGSNPDVAAFLYIDDFVMDWTDATFPLGPPMAPEVPDVVGETEAAGTATLEGEGFVVSVTTAYSPSVAVGLIISQDPEGGETAPPASTVEIVVSLGPQPVADNQGGDDAWQGPLPKRRDFRPEIEQRRIRERQELRETLERAAGLLVEAEGIASASDRPVLDAQVIALRTEFTALKDEVNTAAQFQAAQKRVDVLVTTAVDALVVQIETLLTDLMQEIAEDSES